MNEERSVKALLWAVVVVWGLNVVIVKFLVGYLPPVTLGAIRIGIGTLVLLATLFFKNGFSRISLKSWLYIAGAGLSGVALHQMTLAMGLKSANASTGSLILGLNPLVTGVLAYFLFREPIGWQRIVGIVMGFAGVFVVVMGDSLMQGATNLFHLGKGEWIVIAAMLFYVIAGLFIKKAAETVPVLVVTSYMNLVGTIFLAIGSVFESKAVGGILWPTDWFVWGALLFSSVFATAVCGIWFNNGIQKIGAGPTAMYLNGMPVASLVFAILLLGERFIWLHAVGFGLVFAGIWLGTIGRRTPRLNASVQTVTALQARNSQHVSDSI
ncbi:DMT family transporter [Effusibacillus dendaii]|uniref:Putative transporter YyaM n=1 Tax=Effusibacillus dendaii TaxID=2743772 RepID=A0A7I8DCH9_9BACL|nr:DMT family transporter [Effusibacillus dendaii]BCJ86536.1 putative transporter YyaM [Effusibacillus dendaii]